MRGIQLCGLLGRSCCACCARCAPAAQELRDLPESSHLPTAYSALMLASLVPPLFFRIMDPLLDKFEARSAAALAFGQHEE